QGRVGLREDRARRRGHHRESRVGAELHGHHLQGAGPRPHQAEHEQRRPAHPPRRRRRQADQGGAGMRLALKLTLPGVLALAFVAGAAGPPAAKKKPAPISDQLDYVFFALDRPVLIRMHVRLGEQPYSVAWEAWMNKMFAWFDKNNDGFLDKTEAGRLLQPNF